MQNWVNISRIQDMIHNFGTPKAEVLNSLVMNITAKETDTNDILQTVR